MRLSTTIILAALLASSSAMGQVALSGDQTANEAARKWYAEHAAQSRYEMAHPIPAHLLVIPQAWWTDQGNPEIACYHYDNGPYRDRLIDWCLAKVRGAK